MPTRSSLRELKTCTRILILLVAGGLALAIGATLWDIGQPDPPFSGNIFFVLFARHEPLMLGLILAFSGGMLWLLRRWEKPPLLHASSVSSQLTGKRRGITLIALGVFVTCTAGHFLVMHQHNFSMDEFAADFQSEIFLSGKASAEVREPWKKLAPALKPVFISYDQSASTWRANYLPVYAGIRTFFRAFGLSALVNPVLAALSIFAIAGVARKLWPEKEHAPFLAALLLAVSTQFLLTGMTGYAMPAHLCLNMIWLWLYLQSDRRIFWLTPWVGILALGLHQPFFHALFATPFLFRIVLQRRWRVAAYFAGVYLVGLAGCYAWWKTTIPDFTSGASSAFRFWGLDTPLTQSASFTLLLTWQAPIVILLAILGLRHFSRLPTLLKDAAWGGLLTFVFYTFVTFNQGHGWGYRYMFGVLGNLVLLATAGYFLLGEYCEARRAQQLLWISTLFAILVQLPTRAIQAARVIRPFANASQYIQSVETPLVIIDHLSAWYAADLIRNNPFLDNKPKVLFLRALKPEYITLLQKDGRATIIRGTDLATFGFAVTPNDLLPKHR